MWDDMSIKTTTAVVRIPTNLLDDLMTYVNSLHVEVCGFLVGKQTGNGEFTVSKVHLSRQVVGGAATDAEDTDTVRLKKLLLAEAEELFKEKLIEMPDLAQDPIMSAQMYGYMLGQSEMIIGQWHSHVDMPVFISGGDEKTLNGLTSQYDRMIMLILNKDYDRRAWVSQVKPIVVNRAPVSIEVVDAIGIPLSFAEVKTQILERVFHESKYAVVKGKIVERSTLPYVETRNPRTYYFDREGGLVYQPVGSNIVSLNGETRQDGKDRLRDWIGR